MLEPAIKLLRGRLADDLKGAEGMKENDDGGAGGKTVEGLVVGSHVCGLSCVYVSSFLLSIWIFRGGDSFLKMDLEE